MTSYYYFGLAAAVYIITSWMFAAVRGWHTCNSPKFHRPYVWPDRKLQVLIALVTTVLLPYALDPSSPSAWMLMKSYLPVCGYYYIGILLLCFFGRVKRWDHWKTTGWITALVTMVPMVPLVLDAWLPTAIINPAGEEVVSVLVYVVALLMMGYAFVAMWQVGRWMTEISNENYSNPDDFPMGYARRVWFAPLIYTPLFWPALLWDSPILMAIQNVLMGVMNTALLLTVMPAYRRMIIIPDTEDNMQESELHSEDLSAERMNEIAEKIEEFVDHQYGYLDEHLKIDQVVVMCGYNRNYISRVFQDRFGGFYNYVNLLRLKHFDNYMHEHPEMTKDAAARASGFSSYQAYYRAKERIRKS